MDLEAKILRLLEDHDMPLSKAEIAEKLDLSRKLVSETISRLEYNGLIETRSGGKYVADDSW